VANLSRNILDGFVDEILIPLVLNWTERQYDVYLVDPRGVSRPFIRCTHLFRLGGLTISRMA